MQLTQQDLEVSDPSTTRGRGSSEVSASWLHVGDLAADFWDILTSISSTASNNRDSDMLVAPTILGALLHQAKH